MRARALLTALPSDTQSWPLVFIQRFLEDMGYDVECLGPAPSYDDILEACRKNTPSLLVVSSLAGQAYMEGVELARRLRFLSDRKEMKLVGGGKLGTEREVEAFYAGELRNAGFDGVYSGPKGVEGFLAFLDRQVSDTAVPLRVSVGL